MGDLVINPLPQMAPVSDMRDRQSELLAMTLHGPVVLLAQSKAAAVLLSPVQWDAIAEALAQTQRNVVTAENGRSAHDDNEVDAFAEIAALAQPLGPVDLSINFDKYTKEFTA